MDQLGKQISDFVLDFYAKYKMLSFVILIPTALVYFLPSIITVLRGRKNSLSIIILNLFLGWSLIGWVLALVWSVKEVTGFTPPNNTLQCLYFKPDLKIALKDSGKALLFGVYILSFSYFLYFLSLLDIGDIKSAFWVFCWPGFIASIFYIPFVPAYLFIKEMYLKFEKIECKVCNVISYVLPKKEVFKCNSCGAVYLLKWEDYTTP